MRLVKTEAPPEASPLEVRGVTAAYGSEPVLWDVSFRVPEGQLVAVSGQTARQDHAPQGRDGAHGAGGGRATVFGKPFSRPASSSAT
jgi:hypothetical protein